MTNYALGSRNSPPSDPVDLRDWLLAREEELARLVRARLREIVEAAYGSFLSTLTAAGDPSSLDSIPLAWEAVVASEIVPLAAGIYADGALAAWIIAPGTASLPEEALVGWERIVNYEAVEYQLAASNRLVGVGENVWQEVRARTVAGIEAGWTNEELRAQIEPLGDFSEYRADTIARTEANAAYNGGNFAGAQALGEYGPVAKTWSAAVDRRTRATHLEANEQTVPFGQPFSVGGVAMDRPHDPSAPAREVVNCRCRLLLLFDGDTDSSGRTWSRSRPSGSASAQPAELVAGARSPSPISS